MRRGYTIKERDNTRGWINNNEGRRQTQTEFISWALWRVKPAICWDSWDTLLFVYNLAYRFRLVCFSDLLVLNPVFVFCFDHEFSLALLFFYLCLVNIDFGLLDHSTFLSFMYCYSSDDLALDFGINKELLSGLYLGPWTIQTKQAAAVWQGKGPVWYVSIPYVFLDW